MKQVTIRFMANDLMFFQTIILEDETISVNDFLQGLKEQKYLTTTWHERDLDDENFSDTEITDLSGKRIGYVKSQETEDINKYEDFELIDSIDY